MYCPRCATANADGAKFCRSCGTELETVALVLSGKSTPPATHGADKAQPKTTQDLVEMRIEGVRDITGGASWLAVSLLIGVALALFLPKNFDAPWILIWAALFGWMACVGGVKIGNGISNVLESKSRLRMRGIAAQEPNVDSAQRQLSSPGEPLTIDNQAAASRPSPPLSVTEGTTRQLDDMLEK